MAMIDFYDPYGSQKLFTDEQLFRLQENSDTNTGKTLPPVVAIRIDKQVWLLSHVCDNNHVFGLYMDEVTSGNENRSPVIGEIRISLLEDYAKSADVFYIDDTLETTTSLDVFKSVAKELGRIITDENSFKILFDKYKH